MKCKIILCINTLSQYNEWYVHFLVPFFHQKILLFHLYIESQLVKHLVLMWWLAITSVSEMRKKYYLINFALLIYAPFHPVGITVGVNDSAATSLLTVVFNKTRKLFDYTFSFTSFICFVSHFQIQKIFATILENCFDFNYFHVKRLIAPIFSSKIFLVYFQKQFYSRICVLYKKVSNSWELLWKWHGSNKIIAICIISMANFFNNKIFSYIFI